MWQKMCCRWVKGPGRADKAVLAGEVRHGSRGPALKRMEEDGELSSKWHLFTYAVYLPPSPAVVTTVKTNSNLHKSRGVHTSY